MFNIGAYTNFVEVQVIDATQNTFGVDILDQFEHCSHIITSNEKLHLRRSHYIVSPYLFSIIKAIDMLMVEIIVMKLRLWTKN